MRTHKIVIKLESNKYADWFKSEILEMDFVDLTHWYCGLDHAGEDTPDLCLIYQGYINPEILTVEFDAVKCFGSIENAEKFARTHYIPNNNHIVEMKFEPMDWYVKYVCNYS